MRNERGTQHGASRTTPSPADNASRMRSLLDMRAIATMPRKAWGCQVWTCYTRHMGSPQRSYITPQEYLERERKAEYKSEYWNGQIFAMSGASEPHGAIASNLIITLGSQLVGKGCRVYGSDMRVRAAGGDLYT